MWCMLFSYVSIFILDESVCGVCSSRMYLIFILDDVYVVYALIVCIQFLYLMMCMGRMLFSYVSQFYTG